MISYLKGKVTEIEADYVVVETAGIGYQVFVGHPYESKINEDVLFYTYHHLREDISALYGFRSKEEKELYVRLLSVKGVGPKVGMTILASTTVNMLIQAIDTEDVAYLKKIPGIGPKAAGQIILDLKGKLASTQEKLVNPMIIEATEALTALGYTKKEIDYALTDIDKDIEQVEDIVRFALNKIMTK